MGGWQVKQKPPDSPSTIIPTPLSGDNDPYCEEHHCSHQNCSESIIKEPTCEEDGEKKVTCDDCGCHWIKVLNKLGHDYTVYVDVDNHKCSRCGKLQHHTWKPIYDD